MPLGWLGCELCTGVITGITMFGAVTSLSADALLLFGLCIGSFGLGVPGRPMGTVLAVSLLAFLGFKKNM
jgi:hypothetical protein